ncbi:MAG TPA: 2TM domain-containing protein [Ferruginibacter sp.]|nr:2TM domain-containing protein [Ferruginibacter sp.]
MPDYKEVPAGKDPQVWDIARKRAGFKSTVIIYVIVNAFLWTLWFMGKDGEQNGIPWPAWCTVGWGIGLAFQFAGAYITTRSNHVEIEYQRLKNKS